MDPEERWKRNNDSFAASQRATAEILATQQRQLQQSNKSPEPQRDKNNFLSFKGGDDIMNLQRTSLLPGKMEERLSQDFCKAYQKEGESAEAYTSRLRLACDSWLEAAGVRDREATCNVLVREQFCNSLPTGLIEIILAKDTDNLEELAVFTDRILANRERKPAQKSPENKGLMQKLQFNPKSPAKYGKPNTGSPTQNIFLPKLEKPLDTSTPLFCFLCKQKGHLKRECPLLKKTEPAKFKLVVWLEGKQPPAEDWEMVAEESLEIHSQGTVAQAAAQPSQWPDLEHLSAHQAQKSSADGGNQPARIGIATTNQYMDLSELVSPEQKDSVSAMNASRVMLRCYCGQWHIPSARQEVTSK